MNKNKLTNELIIEDIKRVKEIVNKIPTQKDYKEHGTITISLILVKKPWNKWLMEIFNETNFEISKTNGLKISDSDLLENLKELYKILGREPRQSELVLGKYGKSSYKRAFGSFSNSLKQIGLTAKFNNIFTKEDIINDLIRIFNELERTPSFNEFNLFSKTVSNVTIANKFGSWNEALKLAGIPVIHNQKVSKEEVIEALRAWYSLNKEDVSCLEYWSIRKAKERGEFPFSTNTVSDKFNNKPWEEIMSECGYKYKTVDQFIKRGCFQGYDGRTYLSSIEKQVGDHLNSLKKEGRISDYEYEKKVCGDRNWTCDFVIEDNNADNIWLEIDGMLNNRKDPYISDENEKIEYYKSNGFNYFIISYRTADIKKAICELVEQ